MEGFLLTLLLHSVTAMLPMLGTKPDHCKMFTVLHSQCSKKWSSFCSLLFSYNFSLSMQSYLEISSLLCWGDMHAALFFNFISNRLFLACNAALLTQ